MIDVKERLNEVFQSGEYKSSQIIDSDLCIRWVPLLICWAPDKFLGISELGDWVVEESSGLRVLDTAISLLRIKVILERPISEIRDTINRKLEAVKLDFDSIFPYKDLLLQVIKTDSDYWVEQALRWYYDVPKETQIELKEALEIVRNKKTISQKVRHKIVKELAEL